MIWTPSPWLLLIHCPFPQVIPTSCPLPQVIPTNCPLPQVIPTSCPYLKLLALLQLPDLCQIALLFVLLAPRLDLISKGFVLLHLFLLFLLTPTNLLIVKVTRLTLWFPTQQIKFNYSIFLYHYYSSLYKERRGWQFLFSCPYWIYSIKICFIIKSQIW